MNANAWAGLVLAVLTILSSFMGSIRWLVKHYLSELKDDRNGGHNLEGRIARLEIRIDQIYALLITRDSRD
ncbi:hypothetical protein UFOVP1038_22 [uncultured Caudovirales phage]|uniref:Uncharacterized protein n=1 Tax=uncultured Caudovirales phage TaxID=2100421 RepID=A0A6J5QGU6_9CAUD|nr:hypothetical protein UFOVP1038_22 [uncultured Caudovirales phage]